jgi:hypothetical protein
VILGFPTKVDSRDDLEFQLAHIYSYELHKLKDILIQIQKLEETHIHIYTKMRRHAYSYTCKSEKTTQQQTFTYLDIYIMWHVYKTFCLI